MLTLHLVSLPRAFYIVTALRERLSKVTRESRRIKKKKKGNRPVSMTTKTSIVPDC